MPHVHAANHRFARAHGPRKVAGAARDGAPARNAPSSALQSSVLVLNRLYMAVHVIGVRRAFALLCRELAEVVHCEEGMFVNYTFDSWREVSRQRSRFKQPQDDWIRAVNFEIQVPRVIRLLVFDRLPRQHLHLNRRNVLARDGHSCQYCGRHFPIHQLSLDHVIPRSRGGGTTWENIVCACLACNVKKGGRTPHEAKMTLVHRPAKPQRNPLLLLKLGNPKYESWRTWLDAVYWDIGTRD
ncbi:MAG: HNH endonuclease [Thermoguttaceae bacterium]|jgi:5-methylcytosine-specific restriction endonuclease McrA